MSTTIILTAILLSVLGLSYMTATDPKRRRGAKLQQYANRPLLWPARVALFGPGGVLIALGHWAGLSLWAGAITVIGWAIAAITPATYGQIHSDVRSRLTELGDSSRYHARQLVDRVSAQVRRVVPNVSLPGLPGRGIFARQSVTEHRTSSSSDQTPTADDRRLEARIIALEARLHRLERENDQLRKGVSPDPADTIPPASEATRT